MRTIMTKSCWLSRFNVLIFISKDPRWDNVFPGKRSSRWNNPGDRPPGRLTLPLRFEGRAKGRSGFCDKKERKRHAIIPRAFYLFLGETKVRHRHLGVGAHSYRSFRPFAGWSLAGNNAWRGDIPWSADIQRSRSPANFYIEGRRSFSARISKKFPADGERERKDTS